MNHKTTVGDRIKQQRQVNGLTQVQLGKAAGLSGDWVCNLERGHRRPNMDTLAALARALGVTADFLIGSPARSSEPTKRKVKANGSKNQ